MVTQQTSREPLHPVDLISVSEAARRVGLHVNTLYRLCRRGEFPPAIQIGSRWRVSVPRLERYLHRDGDSKELPLLMVQPLLDKRVNGPVYRDHHPNEGCVQSGRSAPITAAAANVTSGKCMGVTVESHPCRRVSDPLRHRRGVDAGARVADTGRGEGRGIALRGTLARPAQLQ